MLFMPSHITLRSISIILPPFLQLPRGLFPSGLTTKPCMQFLFFPRHATCPFHFILVDLMTQANVCTTKVIYVKMCAVCVLWRNNKISTRTKLRIFRSNVKSVLLYGTETWKVAKTTASKLQMFVNRWLRKILNIHWPEVISNEELWRRAEEI